MFFEGKLMMMMILISLMDLYLFRYHDSEQSECEEKKPFSLSEFIRASLQPSMYRRLTVLLQSLTDDEHIFLLRWSGNTDIDPEALLNLASGTS